MKSESEVPLFTASAKTEIMAKMDWEHIPAAKPPPGVVPNFQDPHKDNRAAYAVVTICLVLSTVAMVTRVVSRAFVVRKIFLPDVLLFAAFGLHITIIAICYRIAKSPGYFVHQWDVNMVQMTSFLRNVFVGVVIFCAYMALIKTAILLEWMRVFVPKGTRNSIFYIMYAVLWINILLYTAMIIVQNIACTPYAYTWDRTIPGGTCSRGINTTTTDIVSSSINLVVDVCILVIPQHVIWTLNMSGRKRFGVAVLFVIGVLGVFAAAGRVYTTVHEIGTNDFVHDFAYVILAGLAEGTCAILVVCGPTMPKAFKQLNSTIVSEIPLVVRSWLSRSSPSSSRRGGDSRRHNNGSVPGAATTPPTGWPGHYTAGVYANVEEHSLQSVAKSNLSSHIMEIDFDRAGDAERGAILRSTEFRVAVSSPDGSRAKGNEYHAV